MQPILSIRHLKTHFHLEERVVRAVDGLSYDLYAGKTLAIVGESGCGKSVHALSIPKLLPDPPARIVSGEILFHGANILHLPDEELRRIRGSKIAMIFQEPMTSLNPVLSIGDQLAEAIMAHQSVSRADALEKSAALLTKVGIPQAADRLGDYPHQFSGGMRQRVMIAMALSCGPEVLIADEPTTALDVTIQAQILDLIRGLQREFNMAVVLITHNIGVVAGMADDVIIMYAGRAVEKGAVDEIFSDPKHPYTKGLLRSSPSLYSQTKRLASIGGQPPDLRHEFTECPFAPRCPEAIDECRKEDPPEFMLSKNRMVNCVHFKTEALSRRSRHDQKVIRA